jgi:hypothetical protein
MRTEDRENSFAYSVLSTQHSVLSGREHYAVTTNLFSPREGIVMSVASSYGESPIRYL